jgi:leucyl/phenylalanyl-tRNA---protein transferase
MLYQLSYTPAARWSGAFIEGAGDRQSSLPPVLCSATMHAPVHPPIPVETLLLAYRSGIFPMADRREDAEVFWVEPRERAILPLGGLHISRSLKKVLRADRFTVTLDRAFEQVIRACADPREDHPETWISERIVQSYIALHRAGHAHSVECWQTGADGARTLVGGLYGVSFDRVFCGESMFSRETNASKVALAWLVALLVRAGFALLDCQFMTEHLRSMGAVELPQREYRKLVDRAHGRPLTSLGTAWRSFAAEADYSAGAAAGVGAAAGAGSGLAAGSGVAALGAPEGLGDGLAESASPGQRIAQFLTQTS